MRTLLFVSAAIVIGAASAPSLMTRYLESTAGRTSVGADKPDGLVQAKARPTAARDQVEIEAERDGHFYVVAELNFHPVRLMVDTGASVVALRQSDAERAGIRVRPADFTYAVATANGTSYAAEARLDSVAVEALEVEGVRALVLPDDQLSVSLLGGSFLNRLARYEVENGTLIFEN